MSPIPLPTSYPAAPPAFIVAPAADLLEMADPESIERVVAAARADAYGDPG